MIRHDLCLFAALLPACPPGLQDLLPRLNAMLRCKLDSMDTR